VRVLIAGAGTIGYNLAVALVAEEHDVVVVDQVEERLNRLENSVDCQLSLGSATSPEHLERCGIRHTDLVIAVTENDAVNTVVCRLADFYRVPEKMARIRDPEVAGVDCVVPSIHLGIDHIISPELLTVEHIVAMIQTPGVREAVDFEGGRVALRALCVSEDSAVAGETLMSVKQGIPGDYLLAAIRRGSRVLIPDGKTNLRIGDTVYAISTRNEVPTVVNAFLGQVRPPRSAVIFGAGVPGTELALRLASFLRRVLLVEPNGRLATQAAERLDHLRNVEVLEGSILDEDLLTRSRIDHSEFYIGISDDDEDNFMGALLYRRYSAGVPLVVVSQPHYLDILESVDLDMVINPRSLATSAILRHLRGGPVLSVAKLRREDAEVIEFQISSSSPITDRPLKELKLPKGLLIAAVVRDRQAYIPDGNFVTRADDRVLVFSDGRSTKTIAELFR
jgi:trk system potassium uptake protein TrkA